MNARSLQHLEVRKMRSNQQKRLRRNIKKGRKNSRGSMERPGRGTRM